MLFLTSQKSRSLRTRPTVRLVPIGRVRKNRVLNQWYSFYYSRKIRTANNRVTRVDTIGMICLGRLTPKSKTALLQRVIMFFIVRAAKNRINKCGAEHFQFYSFSNRCSRTRTTRPTR